jgi:hypothetical protein
MEMKITLRDNNLKLSKWQEALKPLGCNDVGSDNDGAPPDAGVELHLLFLHPSTTATENFFRSWVTKNPNRRLILVASSGRVGRSRADLPNSVFSCWWTPSEILAAVSRGPREFAQDLKQQRFNPNLLNPAPTERLWALRLLCEGFLNPDTKPNLPPNWIQLLGPQGESPDTTIAAIGTDATDLSKDGVAPGKIRAFLTEIKNGGGANKTDTNVADCLSVLKSILGVPTQVAPSK